MSDTPRFSRRVFLKNSSLAVGGLSLGGLPGILQAGRAPAFAVSDSERPVAGWGLQTGDVLRDRAIVWSRADRPARMLVEWSEDPNFTSSVKLRGPHVLDSDDYIGRIDVDRLPPGREVFVRVSFEDLSNERAVSEPVYGSLRTVPVGRRDVRFVWGGDTCGQGWGIDLASGGMRCYEAMRARHPDFFLHCGDTIYADGPLTDTVDTAYGTWTNAFLDAVPEKRKVAETLHEYRRHYLYNLYDENLRRFNAEVPQIWQWDDHETTNNWSPGKVLDSRYSERSVFALVGHATRAFLDYAPMRPHGAEESERVYRRIPYGDDLEVFVLDMRSYRAANSHNLQDTPNEETRFLGAEQIAWLKKSLASSRATWKVIAADMPIGLNVGDGTDAQGRPRWEAIANGDDGAVAGREFEIADVLSFIRRAGIANTVWLTADVHYCAAHYYDPAQAAFSDFAPFWEFVAGPLHAGTFGPNSLDATFGPQVVFQKAPEPGEANLPPSAGLQFFGQVDIDARTRAMTVSLVDLAGNTLFSKVLDAQRG